MIDARKFGWHSRAACKDEDITLFFGHEGEPWRDARLREAHAKWICHGCPVRSDCLEAALEEPAQYGVWGGLDADERTAERRQRLRNARAA